jgi:hypothetical protein
MANRTFSRLQASPPNVLGYFQGTPGTHQTNICLGLRLARLVTLKWLGQRPLSEKMYDLPSNGIVFRCDILPLGLVEFKAIRQCPSYPRIKGPRDRRRTDA